MKISHHFTEVGLTLKAVPGVDFLGLSNPLRIALVPGVARGAAEQRANVMRPLGLARGFRDLEVMPRGAAAAAAYRDVGTLPWHEDVRRQRLVGRNEPLALD
jgi:hypothetical protein